MNIQSISFGKKIPVATCKVKNNETGKFQPATLYEYDCTDSQDMKEIADLPNAWSFKHAISNNMREKMRIREEYGANIPTHFYALKTPNDQIIGISYLEKRDNLLAVKFIQTDPEKRYKYVGQAMLASHALTALNDNNDTFEVSYPTDAATPFYKKKCGFKATKDIHVLEMYPQYMKKFLRKVQFRTFGKIVDIRE